MRVFIELEKSRAVEALAVLCSFDFQQETTDGEEFKPIDGHPDRVMVAGTLTANRLNVLSDVAGVITWHLAEMAP